MHLCLLLAFCVVASGLCGGCAGSPKGIGRSLDRAQLRTSVSSALNTEVPSSRAALTAPFGVIVNQVTAHQKPVVFNNVVDGYRFEVPAGWVVSAVPDHENLTIYVDREFAGPNDGFALKVCPGPTPEDYMGDDGMLAALVKATEIRMAGHPAKEYTYDRKTVAGTRLWTEIISVLNVKGKTYGVIAQIPFPAAEQQYRALYQQIRDSFRLTRP